MRAIELNAFGTKNLTLVEREKIPPQNHEIQIQMKAASLNYRDLLMVRGEYNPRQALPLIPLSDGVGIVQKVGARVTRFKVGDRVCPIFAQGWHSGTPSKIKTKRTLGGPVDGTLQEFMTLCEEDAVLAPEGLTDGQAACLPCAGVTAWSALVTHGQIKAGDSVLVQGTGGVSMFAMHYALAAGARVIMTSSSDEKLERVRQAGVEHTINYRTDANWGKTAKKMAGGDGVDHVVEVGGASTLKSSLQAVRPGGSVYLIGVLSGTAQELNLLPILMQNVRVQGILVGHRESFEDMNRAITQHHIRPEISHVFPWTQAEDAFEVMASGSHFGKIVLKFDESK